MLIKTAKDRKLIFYSEVGEYVNLSMKNPHHRTKLGDILCNISTDEHDSGRPLLSALVVHKKDKKPGGRFFDLAKELGKQKRDEDEDSFYADELKSVFDKWGSGERVEVGFDTLDHAVTERQRQFTGDDDTLDKAQTIFGDQLFDGKLLAGQYRIIGDEPLGSGGMGEVWKATDTELGTTVAIKILPPMMARDRAAIENLKREAMIGQQLTHQNICRLYGFHSEDKLKFIVMEYIDGQTLKEVLTLRDDRKLTWEGLELIARPVAEALDYAHNATYKDVNSRSVKGVLHRDIKPANIMITKDGQAKLMDFGIAREIHNTMTQLTGRSSSLTPMYASPEQFRGEKMTAASDIYSFTAVLYECLAGHSYILPHGDMAYQILHKEFELLASQSQTINEILKAGLFKRREGRPKTAIELIECGLTTSEPGGFQYDKESSERGYIDSNVTDQIGEQQQFVVEETQLQKEEIDLKKRELKERRLALEEAERQRKEKEEIIHKQKLADDAERKKLWDKKTVLLHVIRGEFGGTMLRVKVWLDNKLIGKISYGGDLKVTIKPGAHTLSIAGGGEFLGCSKSFQAEPDDIFVWGIERGWFKPKLVRFDTEVIQKAINNKEQLPKDVRKYFETGYEQIEPYR